MTRSSTCPGRDMATPASTSRRRAGRVPRHATTLHLIWTPGEGFAVEESEEVTDGKLAEQILAAIAERPGTGWTAIEKETPGVNRQRRMALRDELLAARRLVNVSKVAAGVEQALDHCEEGRRARLYLADDPTIRHLLPEPGAVGERSAPTLGAGVDQQPLPAPRPIRGAGGCGSRPAPVPPRPGGAAMTARQPSAAVAPKAQRLLEQRRVLIASTDRSALVSDHPSAIVGGDSDLWRVEARPEGVWCECPAGANANPVSCSHKVAAAVAWAERKDWR